MLVDVPISVYEALLGTKVEVPTLDGPVTSQSRPARAAAPSCASKAAASRGTEKGDEFAVVKVIVPKTLDAEDKELVAKLQAKQPGQRAGGCEVVRAFVNT